MGSARRLEMYGVRLVALPAFALAGCCIAVAGCGGGAATPPAASHGTAAAPSSTPTPGPDGFTRVSFTITVQAANASAHLRIPQFVPAPTTAIAVSINGTTPQTFPCSGSTCSGTLLAPAGGSVNFTFSALDALARPVSQGSVTQLVNPNGTNTIAVTLDGVVDHATLVLSQPGLSSAASGQVTVTATAYDADGDVIPGTYAQPITLAVSGDATGTISAPNATLAGSSSSGTVAYTYSPTTAYVENHVAVTQTSPTESTPSSLAFEVGRTFYTFTPTSVVGFAPGATTPTTTITMPAFTGVTALSCDGTNLYVVDAYAGAVYGIVPGATAPSITYSSLLNGPFWAAGYGGGTVPGSSAKIYVVNDAGAPAIVLYSGAAGGPPFALPANSGGGAGSGTRSAVVVDSSGNVYSALGGESEMYAGYDARRGNLISGLGTGTNVNAFPADQIAVDASVSPPRIYTEEISSVTEDAEISEYDNFAGTPSYISTDSGDGGLFVDAAGRIYTSTPGLPAAIARRSGAGQRHIDSGAGIFDVYPAGGLSGMPAYQIVGQSLAFDSAGYVYAANPSGSITEYAPGGTTVVATFPGTTYGTPSGNPYAFGTFCE